MSCERERTRNLQCFHLSNGMKSGVTERNNMKEIAWINQHFCLGQVKFEMSARHPVNFQVYIYYMNWKVGETGKTGL